MISWVDSKSIFHAAYLNITKCFRFVMEGGKEKESDVIWRFP